MGLPQKLRFFNVFNDGNSYQGEVTELELPKLTRKLEDYQSGGMAAPIADDRGMEALTLTHTYGGIMRGILNQWGEGKHDGVQIRFAGSYQAADSDTPVAVEVTVRGRHKEIDFGSQKAADDTSFKVETRLSYYKLTMNNEDVIEIDLLNMVEKVNGVDRMEKHRQAMGL